MTDHLKLDDLHELLPALEELAPLLDEVAAASRPDPERRWSGSGELETLGRRPVRPEELEARIPHLVEEARARAERIYTGVTAAIRAMAGGDREGAARALLAVAEGEEASDRPAAAYQYALAAHRAARSLRDRRTAALALRRAARAARRMGDLDQAAALYERAWADCRDGDDLEGAVVCALGRGNVSVDRGLWVEAERWYRLAAELPPSGSRPGAPPRPEEWHLHQNLGIVRREQGDLEGSARELERAEALATALRDPVAGVEVNNGWGQLLVARGDTDGALDRFRRALQAARSLGSAQARAVVAVNLGEVLLDQGQLLEAWELAREAEAAALSGRAPTRLPEVYRFLARLAARRDPDHAFVFLERALAIIRERRLPDYERARTLEVYGDVRLAGGETLAAAGLHREALRVYRLLNMDRHARELAERLGLDPLNGSGVPTDDAPIPEPTP